jgi:signal transduction histidine kinase
MTSLSNCTFVQVHAARRIGYTKRARTGGYREPQALRHVTSLAGVETGVHVTQHHPWPFPASSTFRTAGAAGTFIEESSLESVLASAEVGVWQLFGDGQRFVVTAATYAVMGVPEDARIDTAEQWLTRVNPADLDRVAGELERLRVHSGQFTLEAQVLGAGTEARWIEIRGRVVRDETGGFAGACGTVQDVTHRKEPEVFRDLLLATLSHDLRDPLTAIQIGTSLLLRREKLEQRGTVTAKRVMASAKRISAMVDQVLDFTRLRVRGSLPCNRRLSNLGLIAASVVDEMDLAHPGRQIELEHEGNLDGQWDADRLTRLVSNLVANGLVHGDPASPVTIRAFDRGSDVLIVVHNSGAPIPPADLDAIFDPFRRPARPRTSAGLGLGLFIAHEVARSHGAKIWATSSREEGTQFSTLLPRRL